MNKNFIWIDVSNNTLDIYIQESSTWIQVQNNYNTIVDFFKKEIKKDEDIIISEATWVYSSALVKSCCDLWLTHYEVNPKTIHHLWNNIGDRNKTDRIDAEKIANIWWMLYSMNKNWYGKHKLATNSNEVKKLKSIISTIRSFKSDIKKLKQRIAATNKDIYAPKYLIKDIEKSISLAEKNKEKYVKLAMKFIEKLSLISKIENLCTIPWISKEVSLELIILFTDLVEKWFKVSDRSKLKAYVWLDVSFKQSWTSVNKKRISKQWNKHIRSILQIGSRCWFKLIKLDKYKETNLWLFFQRMQNKFSTPLKKNGNSISTAMSKKLLLLAWWIFRNDEPYNWS